MTSPTHGDDPAHKLAELVQELTRAVQLLSDRFRRKRISDGVLALVVAGMLAAGGWYFFLELPDRRTEVRSQIRDLACYAVRLRPPGYSVASDDLRAKYRCPPFDPSALPSGAPTRAPAPGSTITRNVPVPAPTRTVTRPAAAAQTVTVPGPTTTRTVTLSGPRPPARTVTRTATRTATVTRTAGLCLPLLCRTETP